MKKIWPIALILLGIPLAIIGILSEFGRINWQRDIQNSKIYSEKTAFSTTRIDTSNFGNQDVAILTEPGKQCSARFLSGEAFELSSPTSFISGPTRENGVGLQRPKLEDTQDISLLNQSWDWVTSVNPENGSAVKLVSCTGNYLILSYPAPKTLDVILRNLLIYAGSSMVLIGIFMMIGIKRRQRKMEPQAINMPQNSDGTQALNRPQNLNQPQTSNEEDLEYFASYVKDGISRGGKMVISAKGIMYRPHLLEQGMTNTQEVLIPYETISLVDIAPIKILEIFAGGTRRRLRITTKEGVVHLFVTNKVEEKVNIINSRLS
jgi:hypothetical protein